MTLTARGQRFLAGFVLLLGLGVVFADVYLLAAAVAGLALLSFDGYDARRVMRERGGSVRFTPESFQAGMARGDEAIFEARIETRRRVALEDHDWVRAEPSRFEPGESPLTITVRPRLIGHYRVDHLLARASSRFGLFSTQVRPRFDLDVRVYPRFLLTALAVAERLVRSGLGTGGESQTELIGPGLEYAETRPYQPGDSLRRIDWKATARFSSLMVKQFYRESGGGVNFVYFLETPGPRTHDRMATEFLDLVLSATSGGMPVSVSAVGRDGPIARFAGRGNEVLASALSLVLESSRATIGDVYSILDVAPISQEKRALLVSGKERLTRLLDRARVAIDRNPSLDAVIGGVPSKDMPPTFLMLSSLASRGSLSPNLIEDLRIKGCQLFLGYPLEPWEDASSLEEAYRMKTQQEKFLRYAGSKACVPMSIPFTLSKLRFPQDSRWPEMKATPAS